MSDRDALIGKLKLTERELRAQLQAIDDEAKRQGCSSFQLRDTTGAFTYAPVLAALANVQTALFATTTQRCDSRLPHAAGDQQCEHTTGHPGPHRADGETWTELRRA
jgi:hypothetical protein